LVGLPILLLLLDTLAALTRGWRPITFLDRVVVLLILACVALTGLALTITKVRHWLGRRRAQLTLLTISFVMIWFLAELGAGLFLQLEIHKFFHRHKPQTRSVFEPQLEVIPGIYGRSVYTVNSLGLRGPEASQNGQVYRILCIGGSTTECVYLDDTETSPSLLMQALNRSRSRRVWVGNAGKSAYSTIQHLDFIESWDLVPKMDCLILLVGVNDMQLPREFRGNYRLKPVWSHSRLIQLVRFAYYTRPTSDNLNREDTLGASYAKRRKARQAGIQRHAIPATDLERGLSAYQQRLRRIVNFARTHHLRLIFMTQPTLWDRNLSPHGRSMLWSGRLPGSDEYLTVEAARSVLDQYNGALEAICHETGVECVDSSSMNGHEDFFYDDSHFTEAGAREVAHLLSNWFDEHPID